MYVAEMVLRGMNMLVVLTLGAVSGILEWWCGHLRNRSSSHEIGKMVKV